MGKRAWVAGVVVSLAFTSDAHAQAGRTLYVRHCQVCHQPAGNGLAGAFPPLVGSEWVTGSPETLARILVDGLKGPVEVAGARYDNVMPGWRHQLSDDRLATLATFLRAWSPNAAGPVGSELFSAVRAKGSPGGGAWTAAALRGAEKGEAPADLKVSTVAPRGSPHPGGGASAAGRGHHGRGHRGSRAGPQGGRHGPMHTSCPNGRRRS